MNNHDWERNPDYPVRQGVCDHCGHQAKLKLSFDNIRFICIDAKTCINRWSIRRKEK